MKKVSVVLFIALLLTSTSTYSNSFVTGITDKLTKLAGNFDTFRTHRQTRDGVTAVWSFSGATVTGFVVERTYEDPADPYAYWETVATVPATGARSYKVTDDPVAPGFISYRVVAMNGNDVAAYSPVSTEHIVAH